MKSGTAPYFPRRGNTGRSPISLPATPAAYGTSAKLTPVWLAAEMSTAAMLLVV